MTLVNLATTPGAIASADAAPTAMAALFSAAVGLVAALVLVGLVALLLAPFRRPRQFRVVSNEEGRQLVAEARARREARDAKPPRPAIGPR